MPHQTPPVKPDFLSRIKNYCIFVSSFVAALGAIWVAIGAISAAYQSYTTIGYTSSKLDAFVESQKITHAREDAKLDKLGSDVSQIKNKLDSISNTLPNIQPRVATK